MLRKAFAIGVLGAMTACGANEGSPAAPAASVGAATSPGDASLPAPVHTNGRLPPVVIQRIVRASFDKLRRCYQDGLDRDPKLTGLVRVKFVIDTTGAVAAVVADSGSNMPDAAVVGCIVRGFGQLSFPAPEGGMVTVVYPINFDPGQTDAGPEGG